MGVNVSMNENDEVFIVSIGMICGSCVSAITIISYFCYLVFVQQQFSRPSRHMVSRPRLLIQGNVHPVQIYLIIPLDPGESFIQAHLAVADALDLRAQQHHPRFDTLQNEIVVAGLAVHYPRIVPGFLLALRSFLFAFTSHNSLLQTVDSGKKSFLKVSFNAKIRLSIVIL